MTRALEIARTKRLCFTITTGRSGTEYLARALGLFRGVRAEHEPKPTFGSAFRTVQAAPGTAREFWLAHKLPRIAACGEAVYAETSHLVCKGFLESAVELELPLTLIHLVRPPRDVATSLWQLATIPGRTYGGVKYYLAPFDERVLLPLERVRAERLDDYQMCFWYCLEIEARALDYARRFADRGVRVVRCELAEIATSVGVERMGRELQLDGLSAIGRIQLATTAGRRFNEKLAQKRPSVFTSARLDELEAEVRALVAADVPAR